MVQTGVRRAAGPRGRRVPGVRAQRGRVQREPLAEGIRARPREDVRSESPETRRQGRRQHEGEDRARWVGWCELENREAVIDPARLKTSDKRQVYCAVQIVVVKSCVKAVLSHTTTFDHHVYLDTRVPPSSPPLSTSDVSNSAILEKKHIHLPVRAVTCGRSTGHRDLVI